MSTLPGYILRREICAVIDGFSPRPVTVTFTGSNAFTDGVSSITVPAISSTQNYDVYDARVLRGYANHETAHIRYSTVPKRVPKMLDYMGRRDVAKKISAKPDDIESILTAALNRDEDIELSILLKTENVLEDYRIEREMTRDLPGSKINIGTTRDHIVTRESETFLHPDFDFSKRTAVSLGHALGTWMGAVANNYPVAPKAQTVINHVAANRPEVFAVMTQHWPQVEACQTNGDIFHVAHSVAKALMAIDIQNAKSQQDDGDDPGKPKDKNGKNGECDDPGSSPGKGPSDKPGDKDSKSEPSDPNATSDDDGGTGAKGPPPGSDPADGSPDPSGKGSANSTNGTDPSQKGGSTPSKTGKPDPTLSDIYDKDADTLGANALDIQDVLDRIADVLGKELADVLCETMDAAKGASGAAEGIERIKVEPKPTDFDAYKGIADKARPVSGAVATSVRSLMIGRNRRVRRRGLSDGDFDPGALADIAIGSGHVYSRQADRIRTSGALLLLCDVSGSTLAELSQNQTILDKIAESVSAMSDGISVNRDVRIGLTSYTSGHKGTLFHIHKQFDQPTAALRMGIGQMHRVDHGGTPTAQAMLEALAMIHSRKEHKRMIVLITDGAPDDLEAANDAAACIMASGISLIGIGIGAGAMPMSFNQWRTIRDLSDLPVALIDIAKQSI